MNNIYYIMRNEKDPKTRYEFALLRTYREMIEIHNKLSGGHLGVEIENIDHQLTSHQMGGVTDYFRSFIIDVASLDGSIYMGDSRSGWSIAYKDERYYPATFSKTIKKVKEIIWENRNSKKV